MRNRLSKLVDASLNSRLRPVAPRIIVAEPGSKPGRHRARYGGRFRKLPDQLFGNGAPPTGSGAGQRNRRATVRVRAEVGQV